MKLGGQQFPGPQSFSASYEQKKKKKKVYKARLDRKVRLYQSTGSYHDLVPILSYTLTNSRIFITLKNFPVTYLCFYGLKPQRFDSNKVVISKNNIICFT